MSDLYILLLQSSILLTGLVCLWRRGPVLLWIIFGITLLSAINENLLINHCSRWWNISPNILYNIYAFVDITAWCAVFFLVFLGHAKLQKFILIFWLSLCLLKVAEMLNHGLLKLSSASLIFFCGGNILLSIFYFSHVMKADHHELKRDYIFWICSASLCFHSVLLINLLTVSYPEYWKDALSTLTFDILQVIAMTFYNIFICAAFIFSYYRHRRVLRPAS